MDTAETIKQLDRIRLLALVDFLALIPLVICFVIGSDAVKSILGPIHGIGYVGLLYLCAKGAGEGRWGWWFPAIVVVTLGPPGSLIGDIKIRRELEAAGATT
ncbi:hypothetical protein [Paraconexibacter sp. AEG42_29]